MEYRVIWVKRKFVFDLPPEMFPIVVDRLRGTPARLEEKTLSLSKEILTRNEGDSWSIQEIAGHLHDAEQLWHGRIDDFRAGEKEFRPADVTGRITIKANHNSADIKNLLVEFRKSRLRLVDRFAEMTEDEVSQAAYHRRLDVNMRVIDLALFIAEHDDHHLAKITDMIENYSK
nr:DinB family protein [candidate division Zixibacteria bacterium]